MCKLCSRFRNNWNDDERLDGIDFSCIEENGNVRDPRTKKSKVTQNLSTDQKEAKPDPLSLSDRLAAEDCQTLQRNRLPCVILTGFLGSGKTTLLNHILRTSSLKLAVIENEVGEQAIDEKLLETKDDKNSLDTTTEVVLMPNGCLCCRVRGDLVKALKDITNRKESKQLEGIILEMSGLSSLAPVVQTFFANDFVQAHICLDSVICVVDATQAPRLLKMADDKEGLLIREQLSLADLVLVNKIDALQNATDSEMLTTAINQINHTTKTIKCSLRADDMEIIKKLKSHMFTRFNSFL
uniref:CobW/HypB/UreG nucleotide-binding domain-containing protein n=1 Tax=Aplanochytrium stocchinoi TaxID=215587 RepID=A0A7S3PH85_9STRA